MKIFRIFLSILIIFCTIFTTVYGAKKIGENGLDLTPKQYKGVISLWQIDSFEGGVFSRKQFLLKIAQMYEKNNDGVLIMVTNHTLSSAEKAFSEGVFPDLISYSQGLNVKGLTELKVEKSFKGGLIGEKCYAVPWCKGSYVLIENPNYKPKKGEENDETLIVSQADYTQPLLALTMENITAKNVEVLPPLDAYVKFVSGKYRYFLGTQRDIHRLISREFPFTAMPIKNYNDLYQYISITTQDQTKRFYANDFINFLLTEENQKKLTQIGMVSHFYPVEYDNLSLRELATVSQKQTLSLYLEPQKLKELQEISLLAVSGDKEAINKIKKILI